MIKMILGLAMFAAGVFAMSSCAGSASTTSAGSPGTRSASGSAQASSPAAASPAAPPVGYQRVGGAAQGISVAVPASWAAFNPTKETLDDAARRIGLSGISASTFEQDWQSLQKLRGIIMFDVKSAVQTHFATNLNAYCTSSGVTDTGSAGVPLLRQAVAAQLQQVNAAHISQRDVRVGGVPGLETTYTLASSAEGTLDEAQLEVLPQSGRSCFVTVTAIKGHFPGNVVSVAASTAQFY